MEKLARHIGKQIGTSQQLSEERVQVITYGLIAMLQFFSILLIVTLLGVLGSFTYESIFIFLGVGLLRKSTGGAHSQTMFGCMTVSCVSITVLAALSRYCLIFSISVIWYYATYCILFFIYFFIIYKYVPVDSPNKRITSSEKKRRLRKQSFLKVAFLFITTLLLTYFSNSNLRMRSLANSLCLLTLWQCLSLTKTGTKALHFIDSLITRQH